MEESNFDHQGKSKDQVESSMMMYTLSGIGIFVVILWTVMGILALGK